MSIDQIAQTKKGGGACEAEVIQNRPFIRVGRYGHFRTEWTSHQKDFTYPVSQTAGFFKNIFAKKS